MKRHRNNWQSQDEAQAQREVGWMPRQRIFLWKMGPQINADVKIQRKEVDFLEIKPPALRNGEKRFRKTNNRAAKGGYTKTQSQSEGETNTKQGLTRQLKVPQGKGNNQITPLTNQQTTMNPRRANESCKRDLNPKWAEFSNFKIFAKLRGKYRRRRS